MSYHDITYSLLLAKLHNHSNAVTLRKDRTEVGTYSIFGHQMRFDLAQGFPLITTKKVHFHSIVHELLWFLKGDTNIKYLLENNVHIWTEWRYKDYMIMVNGVNRSIDDDFVTVPTLKEFEKLILDKPEFADSWGNIGKGYGHQWRNFGSMDVDDLDVATESDNFTVKKGFDQISWLINEIKTNPTSRRLIVTGWNPHEVNEVDLPPCHTLFQFFVEKRSNEEMIKDWESKLNRTFKSHYDKDVWKSLSGFQDYLESLMVAEGIPTSKLSCQLYQRSADVFLGVPFNIASYALLTHMVAQVCGLAVGEFVWTGGDVHIYSNHMEQLKEQLSRSPSKHDAPTLKLNPDVSNIFSFTAEDITLENYTSYPAIKADVAV